MNHLVILEVPCEEFVITILHFRRLNCPPISSLYHKPWSQLFLISSSPLSMLFFIADSSSMNFSSNSRTEHVLNHCSISKCSKLSFQRVVIHPNRTLNKRVTPFLLRQSKLSRADFRTCDAQRFCCNSLHGSPKMLNLDVLERRLNGSPEYPIFLYCTSLNMR